MRFFRHLQTNRLAATIAVLSPFIAATVHAQPAANSPPVIEKTIAENQNLPQFTGIPPAIVSISKFQAGDALKISVYPDTNGFPSGIYYIDSDGFVDFPLIGFIKVTDLSPQTLQQMLNEKYVTYLTRPNLVVRPLVRVSLLGGFNRPGLYWVDPRESIWNAIGYAGGTQREDGIRKIVWERDNTIVSRNVVSSFEAGTSLYAMGFKSGDQLQVTRNPRMTAWQTFRTDMLPVMGMLLSTAVSLATAYMTFAVYQNGN